MLLTLIDTFIKLQSCDKMKYFRYFIVLQHLQSNIRYDENDFSLTASRLGDIRPIVFLPQPKGERGSERSDKGQYLYGVR